MEIAEIKTKNKYYERLINEKKANMSDFEKALEHITIQIKLYRETDIMDGDQLNNILQQITATLFYLEKERSNFHEKFQTLIHRGVASGLTVSRSENEAHVEVPELYMMRRIMDSAYTVCDAIRTNISYLKTEKRNNN